ncbi:hypothetical protein EG347_02470 [Chryseobacterium sp. G0186]|uniref:hypothetical protein n=1 Tax=Chryseobacterium sp. G0186 TaxID=2487064 RepID=UPI000F4EEDC8|nr:hypothetical protein [Chryseobacterium sp. G0186]AZA76466.1 hypothetical protein EG347_02470 [Chryseobacterium sp. G0186]
MATYESIIKITGTVGDLVFYNLNGKNVVRKKSGFNKTAFKKNPSYEKVRQNSSEFGHCSKMGKMIRGCLDLYIKKAGDPLLYQKFAKLMTEIKDLDTVSERGKRTVEIGWQTEQGKKLLKEFQFGEIQNIRAEVEIKNQILLINENVEAKKVIVVTIKMDSNDFGSVYAEEEVLLNHHTPPTLKTQFPDEDHLLHFVALKKDHDEITHMGFV